MLFSILLRRETEMQDIAVMHGVILALKAHLPGLFRPSLAAKRHKIAISYGFRSNEAFLKVGMDHPSRSRRRGSPGDCPGPRLLRPSRKIGNQPEKAIACGNQAIEAGLLQAEFLEIKRPFILVQMRKLGFDLGRNNRRFPTRRR